MPLCFRIEQFGVAGNVVEVRANLHPKQVNLPQILMNSFPGMVVASPDDDPLQGWDILEGWKVDLILEGEVPQEDEIARFLKLFLVPHVTVADNLDESHCVDLHQLPTEVPQEFRYTPMGELVFRAKYRGDVAARASITKRLAHFIERHPRYARASFIACVPRSSSRVWLDLAEQLVRQLASSLPKGRAILYRAKDVTSQKEVSEEAERYSRQAETMVCQDDLRGQSAVLVDDMYGSGASMEEAARALRAAGAADVLGLAATKTLKYTRGVSL